jgi:alcohol dehydrogenase class IV
MRISGGQEVDVRRVTQGFGADAEVPHAAALAEFAEAVVRRDGGRTAALRATLREALGAASLVDAAATVAAFHGFVRLADAIGIPYTTAARGQDVPELREQAGINAFYRVQARD